MSLSYLLPIILNRGRGREHGASRRRGVVACLTAGLLASAVLLGADASARTPGRAGRAATHLSVSEQGELTRVVVTFTRAPRYLARFDKGHRRMVVDVMDTEISGIGGTMSKSVGVVSSVLTQAFDSGQSQITRLLVNFSRPSTGSIRVEGTRLILTLSELPDRDAEAERQAGEEASPDEEEPGALPAAPSAEAAASSPARDSVSEPGEPAEREPSVLDFEARDGAARISVVLPSISAFEEQGVRPGESRLVVRGASLSGYDGESLDVRAFGLGIDGISARYDDEEQALVVEVRRDGGLRSAVSRSESGLVWTFFRPGTVHSSLTGVALDGGIARRAKTLHVEDAPNGIPRVHAPAALTGAAGESLPVRTEGVEVAAVAPKVVGRKQFSGRRIDLDLKDADVHNVLRLLADVGQVNIVTADDVKGSVTIRMRNVPWDQALEVVLQSKGLGMVRGGNIIRVAPLPQLEHEREMAIARRRQELQLAPLETRLIPVSYAEAEDVQARAREILSGRGSIAVDGRTNVLIARDVAGTLDQVEELVRSLDTQTPQVLVEARIVEATSRYLRDMGIQWGGDASFSSSTGNPTGLAFPSAIGLSGGASDPDTPTAGLSPFQAQVQNPNFAVNLPATVGAGAGGAIGLTLGSVDNNFNLNLRLSAAESTGMVRILSSPRILTLDNHEARISQGTLIPFSQVSAQGVQTTFQEAKLQLMVQPHVTADGSVAMHVKINRDEPDFNQTSARGDPTILKREAETDLLVMDGHTAVIGGIYTRNTGRNVDQVPFFGDIPLIGLLFQNRTSSDQRGELVIFLTPRIVNRAQSLGR